MNHQIIYNLQDVFNLLPNLEGALTGGNTVEEGDSKRPFTVATNDQLLVMYLSSLIRAVIALHDLVSLSDFPFSRLCAIELIAYSRFVLLFARRFSTNKPQPRRQMKKRRQKRKNFDGKQQRRRKRRTARKRAQTERAKKRRPGSTLRERKRTATRRRATTEEGTRVQCRVTNKETSRCRPERKP